MKILHTSDWHLGRMIYGRSLLKDQEFFLFERLIPLLEEERPDCMLIAGDIFDRQIAPLEAIGLMERFLHEAVQKRGCPVLMIPGNHDSAQRLALASDLLRSSGLFIERELKRNPRPVRLNDSYGPVNFYLLPYFDLAQAREVYGGEEELQTLQEAYEKTVQEIEAGWNPEERNLLIGHFFAAGSVLSQSESPLFVGGSGQVAPALFQHFDYTALGHIHSAQRVGEKGWYSGSPLKYSFDEEGHKKGVLIVELETKGTLSVEHRPVVPLRDMRTISGRFEELLKKGKEKIAAGKNEDYILATLTDETPIYEPVARLREVYPNLLGLTTEWMKSQGDDQDRETLKEGLSSHKIDDGTIFQEFLRQVCGEEPSEEDMNIFKEAGRRAAEGGEAG